MQIIIHPVAAAFDDTVTVSGDMITVNEAEYDLSGIPDGAEATASGNHPFAGAIRRVEGVLIVPLRVRYATATGLPDQPTDWDHWTVTVKNGPLPDRVARKPEEDAA